VIALSYLFYNLVLFVLSLFAIPFSLPKILFPKGSFHRERWGFYAPSTLQKLGKKPNLWFHAASVGEVAVALSLLMEMKRAYPHHGFVISTTTPQGRAVASRAQGVDAAFLAPLDLPWIVRRAVKRIRPRLLLVAETELWPNLLRGAKREGIPVILFNGRISQRSYRFYLPLRFFFRGVLANFDALCLKSNADRERMVSLGAAPNAMHVTGDIKFHQIARPSGTAVRRLRQGLRLPKDAPVLIAGSTHEGEEALILQVFKELRIDLPQLILILAPRHLQRIPRVKKLLESHRVRWVRRTMISDKHRPGEVILLDTVGELAALYGLGTAIFVGGSFCRVGGHNILEVLAHGQAVIFGPHMENFSEIAQLVVERGAGIQVRTPEELAEVLRRLIVTPSLRQEMGKKGLTLLQEHQGALESTMKIVKEFFKAGGGPLASGSDPKGGSSAKKDTSGQRATFGGLAR
jgi:3-deoxy-D-manno-octulosonic-acid transferase